MAEPRSADALVAWALGAFHVTALTVAGVAYLHGQGSLGATLSGVGTVAGAVIYACLWLITLRTTRRALRAFSIDPRAATSGRRNVVDGILWAGATGTCFFLALGAIFLVRSLVTTALPGPNAFALDQLALVLLLYGGLGSFVAFLVGAVIGTAFAVIDLCVVTLAIRLADAVLPSAAGGVDLAGVVPDVLDTA